MERSELHNWLVQNKLTYGHINIVLHAEVFEFEPPTITEQPDLDSFPELSRRVTLTCGVFGIPEPNITWFKDGVVLEGERSNNLVIVEVELVDRGRYKCNAENFDPNKDRSATFSDESSEAVVNIKGIIIIADTKVDAIFVLDLCRNSTVRHDCAI